MDFVSDHIVCGRRFRILAIVDQFSRRCPGVLVETSIGDPWATERGVKLHFSRPGKPVDNAFIEAFNGGLRDECLNANWFTSLDHARDCH